MLGDDRLPPVLVVEMPGDGLLDAGLERLGGLPAKLVLEPGRVVRIALVVPGRSAT